MGRSKKVKKRQALRKIVLAIREAGHCARCGFAHPAVLQFHHIDPASKSSTISNLISNNSIQSLRAEVAKCELLCANCHLILHYEETRNESACNE